MNQKEKTFIIQTLEALQKRKARIGKSWYTVTISDVEMKKLIEELKFANLK